MKETIERAAVLVDGVVYDVPRPQRHWHAIRLACEKLGREQLGPHDQGFVTSTGRFVRRPVAARIAFEAGQVPILLPRITTEHLW